MTPRYRMDLLYKGTAYNGWQSQADGSAIQDILEKNLAVFLRHPLRLTGASRTDSGVHAMQQVATFDTDAAYDESRWMHSLRAMVPPDIGVWGIKPVPQEFNPVRGAVAKTYCYRIWIGKTNHPFLSDYAWRCFLPCNLALFESELSAFRGSHDFSGFCAADSSAKTRDRTVLDIQLRVVGDLLEVWILGTGFLKQMVRMMVGTAFQIGAGKVPLGSIARILESGEKGDSILSAPGAGLMLMKIDYEKPTPLEYQIEASRSLGVSLPISLGGAVR